MAAFNHRTTRSISTDPRPPVWDSKAETDQKYNYCANLLIDAVAEDCPRGENRVRLGVLFGTHNWESSRLVLRKLVECGLAVPVGKTDDAAEEGVIRLSKAASSRVTMGQLYGMHDELTEWIVRRTESSVPFVIKLVFPVSRSDHY